MNATKLRNILITSISPEQHPANKKEGMVIKNIKETDDQEKESILKQAAETFVNAFIVLYGSVPDNVVENMTKLFGGGDSMGDKKNATEVEEAAAEVTKEVDTSPPKVADSTGAADEILKQKKMLEDQVEKERAEREELAKQLNDLQTKIAAMVEKRREEGFVKKAAEQYPHLLFAQTEDLSLGKIMKSAYDQSDEFGKQIEGLLDTFETALKEAHIDRPAVGTSRPGPMTATAKIASLTKEAYAANPQMGRGAVRAMVLKNNPELAIQSERELRENPALFEELINV